MTGIGLAWFDELVEQFFGNDLFPVPLAALKQPLAVLRPVAGSQVRTVGDVRIARGVMYPVADLHPDRIEDALLQVIQGRLFPRRQLALHDLTQNVVATGAILERRTRLAGPPTRRWRACRGPAQASAGRGPGG